MHVAVNARPSDERAADPVRDIPNQRVQTVKIDRGQQMQVPALVGNERYPFGRMNAVRNGYERDAHVPSNQRALRGATW